MGDYLWGVKKERFKQHTKKKKLNYKKNYKLKKKERRQVKINCVHSLPIEVCEGIFNKTEYFLTFKKTTCK